MISGSALLDTLRVAGVLDEQEVDEVRSKGTEHERTNELLHIISRTSHEQYQLFLQSLKQANHEHVYIQLTG